MVFKIWIGEIEQLINGNTEELQEDELLEKT